MEFNMQNFYKRRDSRNETGNRIIFYYYILSGEPGHFLESSTDSKAYGVRIDLLDEQENLVKSAQVHDVTDQQEKILILVEELWATESHPDTLQDLIENYIVLDEFV